MIGSDALAACPEYIREADDGTLAALFACVGAQVDPLREWLADPAAVVDPMTAPFDRLPWLAALSGVDIDGVPDGSLREFIANDTARHRGSEAAIRLRVGLTLTGSRSVLITAPYTSAEHVLIQTLTSETPDAAAAQAAARAEVPAWMRLTHEVISGMTYNQLAARYPTYDAMKATGKTYSQLATEAP